MDDEHHPPASHAALGHPRHTGRFWFDFAAAAAAIFISVVSLFVAMSGEQTQRELLAANSWPFLEIDEDVSVNGRDAIKVDNEGVGPAKVVTFEVFYDGQPVDNAYALLNKCCGTPSHPDMTYVRAHPISTGDVADNVIRSAEGRGVLSFRSSDLTPGASDRFEANLGRITFRSCYCSILDRCWVTALRHLDPTPVRTCPAPSHAFALPALPPSP